MTSVVLHYMQIAVVDYAAVILDRTLVEMRENGANDLLYSFPASMADGFNLSLKRGQRKRPFISKALLSQVEKVWNLCAKVTDAPVKYMILRPILSKEGYGKPRKNDGIYDGTPIQHK